MKWKEVKPRCKHIEIGWARSWIVSFFPLMNINDTNFLFNWILLNAHFFTPLAATTQRTDIQYLIKRE